jgi:hypothetical protein
MIRPIGILIAMAAIRDIRLLRKASKDKGRTRQLTLSSRSPLRYACCCKHSPDSAPRNLGGREAANLLTRYPERQLHPLDVLHLVRAAHPDARTVAGADIVMANAAIKMRFDVARFWCSAILTTYR